MANINIYGEFHNDTPDGYVTPSQQIMDTELGKRQDQINRELTDEVRDMGLETAYLTCSTPGNTWKKTISAPDFALSTNVRLLIKMEHAHTSPNSPTLNINETGEYTIQYGGRGASNINSWIDNEVLDVYFDGTQYIARGVENRTGYLVCNTQDSTAAKTVDCPAFNLNTYVRVLVKMTYTNTATNPTLNINGTGAKSIVYNGGAVSETNVWEAGEVLDIYYSGTEYIANTHGGAQFSTGEKVGDVGINDVPGTSQTTLMTQRGVTDITSEYNVSTNNSNAEYTFTQAVALVPVSLQKGGLTIKYIDSTTHEYAIKRLVSSTWNTTESNWQGIDNEPIVGSDNLVKSGGVAKFTDALRSETPITFSNQGVIGNDGNITPSEYYKYSNPTFIKQGYEVVVKSRGYGFGVICTCNQDGTNIQVVVESPNIPPAPTTDYVSYSWTAPTDCYVIVCGQFYFENYPAIGSYYGDVDVLKPSDIDNELDITKTSKLVSNARVAELNNEVQDIKDALRSETPITFSNQGAISFGDLTVPDGTISPSNYYKYSNPIFIKQGYQVNVFSRGVGYEAICQCDSSGNFIQTLVGVPTSPIPTERQLYTWTATEDCYIRVCGQFYYEGEYAESWYYGDVDVLKPSDIDDTHLVNPEEGSLPNAEDVLQLKAKLEGVTAEETKVTNYTLQVGVLNANTKEFIGTSGTARYTIIPVGEAKRVRFLGVSYGDANTTYNYGFGFYNSSDEIFGTQRYEGRNDSGDNVTKEYIVDVPEGAVSLICSVRLGGAVNDSNFYCYLQSGKNVLDMIPQIDDELNLNKTDRVVSNAKVFSINEELQALIDALKEKNTIDFSNQGVIGNDGNITPSEYYKYSNPTFIKQGYEVVVKSRGYGFGVICTCNQDGTNIQVVVESPNIPPAPTDYVSYSWTAPTDCYVIVCGQFYLQDYPAIGYYLGDININNNSMENKTFTAELTMAYLDSTGLVYQAGTNTVLANNIFKTVASVYWIEVGDLDDDRSVSFVPFSEINEGETYKVFFFDKNYNPLSNSVLTSTNEYKAVVPSGTKYLRLAVSSETNLDYGTRYVEVSAKTNILRWSGVKITSLTAPDGITQDGILRYYRTIFEVPYNGQRLWNIGWFFYSPFYKPVGEKTKLVLLYQGSDGYKFNQDWSAFSLNYKSIVFSLVHSGYNVALCSCLASLYGPTSSSIGISDCSGDQLSINAYQNYYTYLIKNFNVEENPYIIGYSNGGMPAGRINILGDIPAKAIAGGAICTDLIGLFRILGVAENINKIMHNCGVLNDVVVEHPGPEFRSSDFDILKSQGDILKNYSPLFMSCDGLDWSTWIDTMKNVPFVDMETNQALVQLMSNVKLQSKVPIKMWHARDDINVSYGLEKFYIEAVNRGGGRAFLRTMPNNSGKHAMGNYGNADSIKIQDYHFKDGTVANTTLFMSEVIEWFEQWK